MGIILGDMLISFICFSQEYNYDLTGNLSKDTNRKISSIHYNFLDLADTISFEDGGKIVYTYSASGLKISEHVIAANRRMIKKRDYINHYLYTNDTLREIRNDKGRTVPIVAADVSSSFDYQYQLTDHLGNARAMLTSQPAIDNSKASLETSVHSEEANIFLRYEEARRVNAYLFDHTRNSESNFSQRLSGNVNEKYGLAKSVSVMPGDTMKLEVFAKYVDPDMSNWTPLLNALMSQVATHAIGVVDDGAMFNVSTSSFPFPNPGNRGSGVDAAPRAYLNWLIFDRNFVFRNGGYVQMNESARENGNDVIHQRLFAEIPISEAGYVYAYLSNEETTPVEVYFDDFTVTQVKGLVIQQSDYDPFGLTFNEYSRENSAPNDFLYNNKELQKDFDLNWYDYGARMYDAALGRWHVIDPMSEKTPIWSPYTYVGNNPVLFTDPDGRLRFKANGEIDFTREGHPVIHSHPTSDGDPEVAWVQMGYVFADDGTPIVAIRNIDGKDGWVADCHGFTFARKQIWIDNDQVPLILKGDGYSVVDRPDIGDVVVYRDKNSGEVVHSATVYAITAEGQVMVTGKGGIEKEESVATVGRAWTLGPATYKFYRNAGIAARQESNRRAAQAIKRVVHWTTQQIESSVADVAEDWQKRVEEVIKTWQAAQQQNEN